VGEVHENCIEADVGVFSGVNPGEVLVLDEHGLCAGDRGVRAGGLWRSWRGEG
jgi:hypothetical protein